MINNLKIMVLNQSQGIEQQGNININESNETLDSGELGALLKNTDKYILVIKELQSQSTNVELIARADDVIARRDRAINELQAQTDIIESPLKLGAEKREARKLRFKLIMPGSEIDSVLTELHDVYLLLENDIYGTASA